MAARTRIDVSMDQIGLDPEEMETRVRMIVPWFGARGTLLAPYSYSGWKSFFGMVFWPCAEWRESRFDWSIDTQYGAQPPDLSACANDHACGTQVCHPSALVGRKRETSLHACVLPAGPLWPLFKSQGWLLQVTDGSGDLMNLPSS
jgi:hypothetical protein